MNFRNISVSNRVRETFYCEEVHSSRPVSSALYMHICITYTCYGCCTRFSLNLSSFSYFLIYFREYIIMLAICFKRCFSFGICKAHGWMLVIASNLSNMNSKSMIHCFANTIITHCYKHIIRKQGYPLERNNATGT